ncbi:MAG: hypothetical protein OXU66_01580 [Gammaproteobacteria bacterium]|nr:hypothetical protein [Gammaproteobacteria bacterium]MDD9895377.1 hypothetical protein [Gammaproteobacteria bacterium]MDD9957606.1 hypothetical protein [Gammaproteobacteria bacterium]
MLAIFRLFSMVLLLSAWAIAAQGEVLIKATPDNGVQPRLTLDANGGVHLLYFKKRLNTPAAREGNLYYRQYDVETGRFGLAVKVSSSAFAMQTFSIARAAMAITDDGRIHVMWYYPRTAEFIYSRSNPERTAFEQQRSMVENFREGIDAGGDLAAIGSQVALVWGAGDLQAEDERTMFARFSHDAGESFGEEIMLSNPDLGACACCSLATDYLDESNLLVAYRSAIDGIGRHMQLLTVSGTDNELTGASYGSMHDLQQWELSACPLSTNDIVRAGDDQRWLVFETESRIVQMDLRNQADIAKIAEPFTETRQKNPALAINDQGLRLIAWGEAISHARGGRLNIRIVEKNGEDTGYVLEEEIEITQYSFPAAAALPDGNFLVLY